MPRTRNNGGTKGEIQCIKHCFENRNNSEWCKKHFNEPNRIQVIDLVTKKVIQNIEDIKENQAPNKYKADVLIRLETSGEILSLSIKTTNCAAYAVMNHTHRNANAFQKKFVEDLPTLDKIIKFYLEKRIAGEYGEDVHLHKLFKDLNCGDKYKDLWMKLITYFTFSGTGKGPSEAPADSILLWNGNNIKFISCKTQQQKEDYIESLLSQDLYLITMSIRAPPKGMPRHNDNHVPWIFKHHKKDGTVKIKGALHIRIEKKK